MYVGYDPSKTWTNNYDLSVNRHQLVAQTGGVQAVHPFDLRAPGVFSALLDAQGRHGEYVPYRGPARNDSDAVRRVNESLVARRKADGTVNVPPLTAQRAAAEMAKRGKATIPVRELNGHLGLITIEPQRTVETARRMAQAQQAQALGRAPVAVYGLR